MFKAGDYKGWPEVEIYSTRVPKDHQVVCVLCGSSDIRVNGNTPLLWGCNSCGVLASQDEDRKERFYFVPKPKES